MEKFRVGRVTAYKRTPFSRWTLYWRLDGKRHRKTIRTARRDYAEKIASHVWDAVKEIDYDGINRALLTLTEDSLTFSAVLNAFESTCPNEFRSAQHDADPTQEGSALPIGFSSWRSTTWRGNYAIRRRFRAEWGKSPMRALTTTVIEAFLQKQEHVSSTRTRNNYLGTLSTIMKWAKSHRLINDLPTKNIRWKRTTENVPVALSDTELEKLYAKLRDVEKHLSILLHDTGLRISEALNLRWEDVRCDEGLIVVRDNKSTGQFRCIPLTKRANRILINHRLQRTGTVLVELYPYTEHFFREQLRKAALKAGIRHVHPHLFRHTYATELVDEGVSIEIIQKLLGHRTISMTQRYARKRGKGLKEAVSRLNR